MSDGGIKQLLSIRSAAIKRGDAEARDRANDILAKISGTEFRGAEDPGRIRITTGDIRYRTRTHPTGRTF
jgi:hypothetical protein